jgi:hypothetical protein
MKKRNRLVFSGALAFCLLISLQAYAGTLQYDQPKGMDPFAKNALLNSDVDETTNFEEFLFNAIPLDARLFPLTLDPDFDQNLHTDVTVWRPTGGRWFGKDLLSNATFSKSWGQNGDIPFTGQFDFDGITDVGVWRPGNLTWYVLLSSFNYAPANALRVVWGIAGGVPVPGDYDGDGITDFGIWRPSNGTWYIQTIYGVYAQVQWGANGDVPVPGDYDGDLMWDFAVWTPSTGVWSIMAAIGYTFDPVQWGTNGDVPVPTDYDGDGATDLGIWRPSTGIWYLKNALGVSIANVIYGKNGDIPLAGDYDGDGAADIAIWRPSNGVWYIRWALDHNFCGPIETPTCSPPEPYPPPFSTGQKASWGVSGDLPLGCTPFSGIQKYLTGLGYY